MEFIKIRTACRLDIIRGGTVDYLTECQRHLVIIGGIVSSKYPSVECKEALGTLVKEYGLGQVLNALAIAFSDSAGQHPDDKQWVKKYNRLASKTVELREGWEQIYTEVR